MADGRYRVNIGADGVRYLHFFPPDGGKHLNIILDTAEDEEELEVCMQFRDGSVAVWSVDAFESFLHDLVGLPNCNEPTKGKDNE